MKKLIAAFVVLAIQVDAKADNSQLRRQAEKFAGVVVNLDDRVAVPDCPDGYAFQWASELRRTLSASCPSSRWSLVLVAGTPRSSIQIRRGQQLRVEAFGPGFRVSAEALAEANGGNESTIPVRNSSSGKRFTAVANSDGRIFLPGRP